jgi:D-alanyl-D-alanine endopeptidase (penicillin-binding protein 7)
MQNDIPLKTIASVAILVLIIGLINTARIKEQSVGTRGTTAVSVSNNFLRIDSSFFNFNAPYVSSPDTNSASTQNTIPSVSSSHTNSASSQNPTSVSSPQSAPSPRTKTQAPVNIITADSYLVGNLATGKIYFEKDPTAVRSIASISKLVTAMVIEKNMDPNGQVAIASSSVTGYEQVDDVHPGETFSVSDLEKGMLLLSSNDAALAFANNYGYMAFMSLMNADTQSLGMTQTSFEDPSGLSPENVSSANDLFKLARYLYADEPGILAITKTPEFDLATTTGHDGHNFMNFNPFVFDPHYLGGKTGRTDEAGETMLSIFSLPINGVNNPIAIIVLHSSQDSRQTDSDLLVGKVLGIISGQ